MIYDIKCNNGIEYIQRNTNNITKYDCKHQLNDTRIEMILL